MAKRETISVSRAFYDRLRAASETSGIPMSRIVEAALAEDLTMPAPAPSSTSSDGAHSSAASSDCRRSSPSSSSPERFEWRGVVRAWNEPIPDGRRAPKPSRRELGELRTIAIRGETRVDRALREARREVKRAGVSGDGYAYGGAGHGSRARFDRAVSDAFCRRLRELGIAVEE